MEKERRSYSISKRLPIIIAISFAILLVAVVSVTYMRMERRMVEEHERMADGVTNLMIEHFDPEKIDYYIEENYSSREYLDIMKFYYSLKDNYPDIYYMYVYSFYRAEEPSATIIIDLEDEYTEEPNQVSIDWVGSTYVALEPFASLIEELLTSKEPIFETAFDEEDGYLLSYAKPILDADGNYVASACVDFSLEEMHKQNIEFALLLALILAVVGAVVLFLLTRFLTRMITRPLLSITGAVSEFQYDTEDDVRGNLETLKSLDIKSDNEIGVLYQSLLTAEEDSLYFMSNFNKAKDEIDEKNTKINELGTMALRDSMTNVGNKAAYTQRISDLKDDEEYGIVLMDANNLKMINDTYGHEAGDNYIKGCCKILCDTFSHSPVFRIGGDEFAVILKGRDYENRHTLVNNMKAILNKIWLDKESDPINRYSCAIGMADSTTCSTTRETIKTADEAMYEDKKLFKEKNGSYR
ncbi:MAG: diguanylate cyclase [Lachnospiraceae bacterium]|nr:diguanylate cyclase [Lachnospiraceae bacterium]